MAPPAPPTPPEEELERRGWTRSEDRSKTVFEGLGVTVESRTLVYEDRELRRAVADAGGPDRIWRFLFVSRLELTPSPAFGMQAAVRPQILRESKQAFGEELHERGIDRIGTGDTERVTLGGDRHARLTPYRGFITVEPSAGNKSDGTGTETEVRIVGRLALWYDDEFYIAGCAGPTGRIDGWAEADTDGETLVSLIRTVSE